jgi:tetratricopeptide (TPR) repeat protein
MRDVELSLRFSGNNQVNVSFDRTDSGTLPFENPVTAKDRDSIRWYIERYSAHSLDEPDDQEAKRIEARLVEIGKALFKAVFSSWEAGQCFIDFRNSEAEQRVLTIDAQDASILSIPWELLHDPKGVFLVRERPHISIRRKISGATGGRPPFPIKAKDRLHLLFIVSPPEGAGFLDPRADPKAVIDALEEHAPGRVTYEFLRPATLNALVERLDDKSKPPVDILHFDGHGTFREVSEKQAKETPELYGKSILSEIHREHQAHDNQPADKPAGIGFLVFENKDGGVHLVSAADLGDNLFQSKVMMVVLSACQTAMMNGSDPLASVAGRLTTTGIPSILAMTHSVLAVTTKTLFGQFYEKLAKGSDIAAALDGARVYLDNNPERYEVQRGLTRRMLELEDWFVPALFSSSNAALLTAKPKTKFPPPVANKSNLRPEQEAGFFGRRRELWDIERWFAVDKTRRISITGFGGQGKTELALEAGRWLMRACLFKAAVFVDYAQVQAEDALTAAISTISTVLGQTLPDAAAVTTTLAETPALIILDNLEAVSDKALKELLDAAVGWSEAGHSRVLLTSRKPDFNHPGYRVEGTRKHRRIALEGLGSKRAPDDAIDWFIALQKLPPEPSIPAPGRDALIALFDRVQFHPLSIAVLAQQLKTRTAEALGQRLEANLHQEMPSGTPPEGTPKSLIASLQLSLERLTEEERHAVRLLGVFQGGAFEDDLLAITELGEDDGERVQLQAQIAALESGDPRVILRLAGMDLPDDADIPSELLAQLSDSAKLKEAANQLRARLAILPEPAGENLWPKLRSQLEATALIEAESIPGVNPPYLRFHPTLAPMLWAQLDNDEKGKLSEAYRQRYYVLAKYLYREDTQNPDQARAIARRELPNLLHAVRLALDAGDPDAVNFVDRIRLFLTAFGMTREAAVLTRQAEKLGSEKGSNAWLLAQSNRGEQLYQSGQAEKAAEVFSNILRALGDEPTFERATTLARLGRCYGAGGRPDLAGAKYQDAITVNEALEQSDSVKQQRGIIHSDLADVLRTQGKFAEAREHYGEGLKLGKEVKDLRHEGVVLGQLGTLAMAEGDLAEAVKSYHEALKLFQRLNEPLMESVYRHQLGVALYEANQWDEAETHLRRAADLCVSLGLIVGKDGAASTWIMLAVLNAGAGRPEAAETWYRKVIEVTRQADDMVPLSVALSNLASLLMAQPERLAEARKLAEEALAIRKTLDPGAAQIWRTYTILAGIADQEGKPEQAAQYRRLERDAKRAFAGTAHEMRRHLPLILATCQAVQDPEKATEFDSVLSEGEQRGFTNLVGAIRRMLAGERNPDALCDNLDLDNSMIVETILDALDNPAIL